jgi:HemY protein
MRRFILILLIFILSVFLGLKIAKDPGFAFFSYQQWSVEMPLWFAGLLLVILFFIVYLFIRVIDSVDFSVYRWKNWRYWRRKNKSYSTTNRGLLELIEGDWRVAENHLLSGISQSDAPLINYLAAAKAAQQQGAYDKRDSYLRKAHDLAPHAELAVGLTQAQLLFEQGQLEQALATLGHLRSIAPKNKIVLKLLERLYVHLGDWQELLALLPSLRKVKLINQEQNQIFEKKIYCELLKAAKDKNEGLSGLQLMWNSLPRKLQKDPEMMITYAGLMLSYPAAAAEVESMLGRIIKQGWNEDAVRLYGLLVMPSQTKQLSKAEIWLKNYPDQAALLLTLGRLCVRCQLWGKARNYFESSLKLQASSETYIEYGKLLEVLGEQTAAVSSYREGLLLAAVLP